MVIAERNKKYYIPSLILGVGAIVAAILTTGRLSIFYSVAIWVCAVFLCLFTMYGFLVPGKAIVKDNDKLIVNYLFKKKIIPLSMIDNVAVTERGEYYNRKSSVTSDIAYFNDMRRLTINYKENGILRHASVFVKDASAAKCSIDGMFDRRNVDGIGFEYFSFLNGYKSVIVLWQK